MGSDDRLIYHSHPPFMMHFIAAPVTGPLRVRLRTFNACDQPYALIMEARANRDEPDAGKLQTDGLERRRSAPLSTTFDELPLKFQQHSTSR